MRTPDLSSISIFPAGCAPGTASCIGTVPIRDDMRAGSEAIVTCANVGAEALEAASLPSRKSRRHV
jgi:hypothetical protein